MLSEALVIAGALVAAAVAGPINGIKRCSTPEVTEEQRALAKQFAVQEANLKATSGGPVRADITVNVYLHSVSASESTLLSDETLKAQMDALTARFSGTGFHLVHASNTKTVNATWAVDDDEIGMKKALRKGNYRDLNLYFLDRISGLGYCYYPTAAPVGSNEFYRDGCTNLASTVPGGKPPFGMGLTAVHETGHWMGLMHTFSNGCSAPGDEVDDTPAQASSTLGCPTSRDSCPKEPGLDPIHNYMDYSDDACYTEFTPGQNARMLSNWETFRENK